VYYIKRCLKCSWIDSYLISLNRGPKVLSNGSRLFYNCWYRQETFTSTSIKDDKLRRNIVRSKADILNGFCKLDWKGKNSEERRKGHKGRNRIKER
jgi:hypothetical protein